MFCPAQDSERIPINAQPATGVVTATTIDAGDGTRSVALFVTYSGIAGSPAGCHIAIRGGIETSNLRLLRAANLTLHEVDNKEFFQLNLRGRYLQFQYLCSDTYPNAGTITVKAILSSAAVVEPDVVVLNRTTTPPSQTVTLGSAVFDPYHPYVGIDLIADGLGRVTISQLSTGDSISQTKIILQIPVQTPNTAQPGMGLHPVNVWCIPVFPNLTSTSGENLLPFGRFSTDWQNLTTPTRFEYMLVSLSPGVCRNRFPSPSQIFFYSTTQSPPLAANQELSGADVGPMRFYSGLYDELYYSVYSDKPGTLKIVQWSGDLTTELTTDSISISGGVVNSGAVPLRGTGVECTCTNGNTAQTQFDASCWARKKSR